MNHLPTAQLIAVGRQLTNTIRHSKEQLSIIEEILRSRALSMPHEPLSDANREGRRAVLKDADQEVSVTFESDLLKASFPACTPIADALQGHLTETEFSDLFATKTTHERRVKDGQKFRIQCAGLLGSGKAAAVIDTLKDRDKNGITKSKTTFAW